MGRRRGREREGEGAGGREGEKGREETSIETIFPEDSINSA